MGVSVESDVCEGVKTGKIEIAVAVRRALAIRECSLFLFCPWLSLLSSFRESTRPDFSIMLFRIFISRNSPRCI
jgi:hypothetical protein